MSSTKSQHHQPNDIELMEGIAKGDETAFAAVYDRYSGLLFTICLRILPTRAEAEDALVDIFWEVWEKGARFDLNRGSPRTYLTMLARSRAIDRLRAAANDARASIDADKSNDLEPESTHPQPDQSAVASETRQVVDSAMQELPDAERRLIELSFYDGLSHSEIAKVVLEPLGTIKSKIRRGLRHLRKFLRNHFAEGGFQ